MIKSYAHEEKICISISLIDQCKLHQYKGVSTSWCKAGKLLLTTNVIFDPIL